MAKKKTFDKDDKPEKTVPPEKVSEILNDVADEAPPSAPYITQDPKPKAKEPKSKYADHAKFQKFKGARK